jgi:hypothetical protein
MQLKDPYVPGRLPTYRYRMYDQSCPCGETDAERRSSLEFARQRTHLITHKRSVAGVCEKRFLWKILCEAESDLKLPRGVNEGLLTSIFVATNAPIGLQSERFEPFVTYSTTMLFRSAVLLLTATAGFASAGIAPELFIGVSSRTDASDLTGSLEPSIKWTTGGSVGDYCDYEVRTD